MTLLSDVVVIFLAQS